jgi:hypothetical protein
VRKAGDKVVFSTLSSFPDEEVRAAAAARERLRRPSFVFESGDPPVEYVASFIPFPHGMGKKWEILAVEPAERLSGH